MNFYEDNKSSVYDSTSDYFWNPGNSLNKYSRKISSMSLDTSKNANIVVYKSKGTFPTTNIGTEVSFWFSLNTIEDKKPSFCFILVI